MTAPPDPREDRYRPLGNLLLAAVIGVASLGTLAMVIGGELGEKVAVAMLLILVGTPLLRVAWLVNRWYRRGDTRFALVGTFVLLVPLVGFLLSR